MDHKDHLGLQHKVSFDMQMSIKISLLGENPTFPDLCENELISLEPFSQIASLLNIALNPLITKTIKNAAKAQPRRFIGKNQI